MQICQMIINIIGILFSIAYAIYTLVLMINIDKAKMPIMFFVLIGGLVFWFFDLAWWIIYLLWTIVKTLIPLGRILGMIQMYAGF